MVGIQYKYRWFRSLTIGVLIAFIAMTIGPSQKACASYLELPVPGVMVKLSAQFLPPVIKGIKVDPANPLSFDFLIDPGQESLTSEQKKTQYRDLIKYFLASLTIPEKDMWVNLSPYEHNRVISSNFGETEMGRDMLGQDYILKQLTASLVYPEDSLGKKFWSAIYERMRQETGSVAQIPVNTFNKVWIIPQSATVFEKGNVAIVTESHLKVLMEEDYVALNKLPLTPSLKKEGDQKGISGMRGEVAESPLFTKEGIKGSSKDAHTVGSQVVREIIIPAIETEVNEGKNFAQLRQMYNSMILASWFKQRLKMHLLNRVYVNKDKNKGVELQDPKDIENVFQKYIQAYKKGVYNYIKEEKDPASGKTAPKKYFSGGFTSVGLNQAMDTGGVLRSETDVSRAMKVAGKSADLVRVVFSYTEHRDISKAVLLDPKITAFIFKNKALVDTALKDLLQHPDVPDEDIQVATAQLYYLVDALGNGKDLSSDPMVLDAVGELFNLLKDKTTLDAKDKSRALELIGVVGRYRIIEEVQNNFVKEMGINSIKNIELRQILIQKTNIAVKGIFDGVATIDRDADDTRWALDLRSSDSPEELLADIQLQQRTATSFHGDNEGDKRRIAELIERFIPSAKEVMRKNSSGHERILQKALQKIGKIQTKQYRVAAVTRAIDSWNDLMTFLNREYSVEIIGPLMFRSNREILRTVAGLGDKKSIEGISYLEDFSPLMSRWAKALDVLLKNNDESLLVLRSVKAPKEVQELVERIETSKKEIRRLDQLIADAENGKKNSFASQRLDAMFNLLQGYVEYFDLVKTIKAEKIIKPAVTIQAKAKIRNIVTVAAGTAAAVVIIATLAVFSFSKPSKKLVPQENSKNPSIESKDQEKEARNVGGIDFDSQYLQMNLKGDPLHMPIPQGFEWMLSAPLGGLVPQILEIHSAAGFESSFFKGVFPSENR